MVLGILSCSVYLKTTYRMRTNCDKRLGDYIREVNVRNRDLKVTKPMGINIDKHFMPSVANVIGTDLSNYKLVSRRQFACNLMHVGRDEKIPMAIMESDNPIIVSPAYFVFEVSNPNILLPEYLMMWFSRKEFDRNAWFYTDADVRGGMDKGAFLDMRIPIPSIERQREIVAEYETLSKRIHLNEQLISKLEDTAHTLYRKMFVDGINKEKLPEGWRIGKLGEVATFKYGKVANKHSKSNNYPYPIYSGYAITGYTNEYSLKDQTIVIIARGDAGTGRICMSPHECFLSNLAIAIETKNDKLKEYLYYHLLDSETDSLRSGSAQAQITINNIEPFEILIPESYVYSTFSQKVKTINRTINLFKQDNSNLTEIQSLLLAKMGK